MEQANAALAAKGLPPHVEPPGLEHLAKHNDLDMPWGFLEQLRDAYIASAEQLASLALGEGDAEEPDIDDGLEDREESHLCNHSDTDGIYLPIDFADPIWIGGLSVGSAVRLRAELEVVSEKLAAARRACEEAVGEEEVANMDLFMEEEHALDALMSACDISLKHRTAIVFS